MHSACPPSHHHGWAGEDKNNTRCSVPLEGLNPTFYAEDHAIGLSTWLGWRRYNYTRCNPFKRSFFYAEDHAIGLSTFTIMAGLGGSLGYAMGALNWGWLGNHLFYYQRLLFLQVNDATVSLRLLISGHRSDL
jgi:hypothetical protein